MVVLFAVIGLLAGLPGGWAGSVSVVKQYSGWSARVSCGPAEATCAAAKCGRTVYRTSDDVKLLGVGHMYIGDDDDRCDFDFVHYVRTVKDFFTYNDEGKLCYPKGKVCPNGYYPSKVVYLKGCKVRELHAECFENTCI
eukprot:1363615-Amorphochlora_amoeboformis.AAC.1